MSDPGSLRALDSNSVKLGGSTFAPEEGGGSNGVEDVFAESDGVIIMFG